MPSTPQTVKQIQQINQLHQQHNVNYESMYGQWPEVNDGLVSQTYQLKARKDKKVDATKGQLYNKDLPDIRSYKSKPCNGKKRRFKRRK